MQQWHLHLSSLEACQPFPVALVASVLFFFFLPFYCVDTFADFSCSVLQGFMNYTSQTNVDDRWLWMVSVSFPSHFGRHHVLPHPTSPYRPTLKTNFVSWEITFASLHLHLSLLALCFILFGVLWHALYTDYLLRCCIYSAALLNQVCSFFRRVYIPH